MNRPEFNDIQDPGTRTPPQAPEVEESVLGAMLIEIDSTPLALSKLRQQDFYLKRHQFIFKAIADLYHAGEETDMLTVEHHLTSKGLLDAAGGSNYLVDLLRSVSSAANIEYHAEIIRQKSLARQSIQSFHELINKFYDPSSNPSELLIEAEQFIYTQITGRAEGGRMELLADGMQQAVNHLKEIQGAAGGITGLASGLPHDEVTTGYHPGKVYVVAGRPGMGKTAFMLQNLKTIAKSGTIPGILSLEMDNLSLRTRLLLAEAGIENQRAYRGQLTDSEIERMEAAGKDLESLGMVMDDTTDLNPSMLRIKARMMKQVHKIGILAIDYIQLMTSDQQVREQQVADISRTCKKLAKELEIPVIALAQLSRKPDDRRGWGTRPQLSDLRESGAIEQDADVVMFLYRPEEYGLEKYENTGASTAGVMEVIIAKHRNGPTGIKKIFFEKETISFKQLHSESGVPHPADKPQPVSNWYETDESPF